MKLNENKSNNVSVFLHATTLHVEQVMGVFKGGRWDGWAGAGHDRVKIETNVLKQQ